MIIIIGIIFYISIIMKKVEITTLKTGNFKLEIILLE